MRGQPSPDRRRAIVEHGPGRGVGLFGRCSTARGTRVPARWCDCFRHRPGPQAVAGVVGMEPVRREVAAGIVAERPPRSARYVDVGRTWGPGREGTGLAAVESPSHTTESTGAPGGPAGESIGVAGPGGGL